MVPNRVVPDICKKFSDGDLQVLPHYLLRPVEHFLRRNRSHAAMIDRAFAQHARRALRWLTNDLARRTKRARCFRISRPENYESWRTHGRPNVGGPGVVRN